MERRLNLPTVCYAIRIVTNIANAQAVGNPEHGMSEKVIMPEMVSILVSPEIRYAIIRKE